MAKGNFFKDLIYLEKRVILENKKNDNGETFSEKTFQAVSELLTFVTKATFSRSEHTQFICRHYKYPQSELPDLYFAATGKKKSASTFRNQHQKISDELYIYFGTDFLEVFLAEDEARIRDILGKISVLSVGDVFFEDLFNQQVSEFIAKKAGAVQRYNLIECVDEIDGLIAISKLNIENILSSLDVDKMNYIMSLFHRPLMEQGILNKDKLEILTRYADVISNTKGIKTRIQSRKAIEYDEAVIEDVKPDAEVKSSDEQLDDLRMTTSSFGDFVMPSVVASSLLDNLIGVEARVPTKEDEKELLNITYLLHFYQMSFINSFFSEVDPTLLKFVLSMLSREEFEDSIYKPEHIYKMVDGYNNTNNEYNLVCSQSLAKVYKSNAIGVSETEVIQSKKGITDIEVGTVSAYLHGDDSFKTDAERIMKKYSLSEREKNSIYNSSLENDSIDKVMFIEALNRLRANLGDEKAIEFMKGFLS